MPIIRAGQHNLFPFGDVTEHESSRPAPGANVREISQISESINWINMPTRRWRPIDFPIAHRWPLGPLLPPARNIWRAELIACGDTRPDGDTHAGFKECKKPLDPLRHPATRRPGLTTADPTCDQKMTAHRGPTDRREPPERRARPGLPLRPLRPRRQQGRW